METISAVVASNPVGTGHVHAVPPLTPSSLLRTRPGLLAGLALLFTTLALFAAVRGGQVLLLWDDPIQQWVESNRTSLLDTTFRTFSLLGSTVAVLSLGVLATAVTWRRCRAVGMAFLVATFSRPLLEHTFKVLVGRDRPNYDRMVEGNGPSFPTGHVMAAIALWGLLPVVVSLYTRRRSLWWASVGVSVGLIVGIGASRIYLGVHWFSDVTGGLVIGAFFLLGIEALLARQHQRHPCHLLSEPLSDPPAAHPARS